MPYGWFAGTVHLKPWGKIENRFTEDVWELYHVKEDFSMSRDLAKEHPDILAELQRVFLAEAVKYKVLPLDDRRLELFNPKLAGRPDLMCTKLPKGKSTVKMDFAYDGGKPGSGGTATLYIDGQSVGSDKVEQTQFAIFSADETAGVGVDAETPVSEDYDRASSKFTGTIDKVTINLK